MISNFQHAVFYLEFSGEFDFDLVHLVHFVFLAVVLESESVWGQVANLVQLVPMMIVVSGLE